MRFLKLIYSCFLILLPFFVVQLYGQQLPLQTLSLAADSFVSNQVDGIQMDWRLDLGLTNMSLDQTNAYCFSAGFLQPTIHRFANNAIGEKYNPSIELKNTFRGEAIILFSKEPDLILFGYKILNLQGQLLINDQTKYRSGYLGRFIHLNALASGVYMMQVLYLPEYMTFDSNTNYLVKYIKFIKP